VTLAPPPLTRRLVVALIALGLVSGFLSGLLGIGGGLVIVPVLVLLGYDIKLAGAVSLLAVFVICTIGTVSFAVLGEVDWVAAALVAVGSVAGVLLGTRLVAYLPTRVIQLAFAVVLLLVAASLFWIVPDRDAALQMTPGTAIALVVFGVVIGFFSSLLGLGGAFLVVPGMMLVFQTSDLLAKTTALAMMIPTTLVQSAAARRAGRGDTRSSLLIAAGAALTTTPGALLAVSIDPVLSNVLFAVLLVYLAGQLVWRASRAPHSSVHHAI
jgi:uncharacterized protein